MTETFLSSSTGRVAVVPGDGLVQGNRVGVSPADLAYESTGLLAPDASDPATAVPVRLSPVPGVPSGGLALAEALARETGISGLPGERWQLRLYPAVPAATVVLEPMVDLVPDEAVRQLRASTAIDGQVFMRGGMPGSGTAWFTVDGVPYRVRAASDAQGRPLNGLMRISVDTQLDLFVSGARAGVDIVILADCSGSMSWDDVRQSADARPGAPARRFVTRMDALKQALRQMADARMRVGGRAARIAMVKFTRESVPVFPIRGGMAEVGTDDNDEALREFRSAIGRLRPEEAGTDIGQAVNYAGDLLHQYGVPHNERLIVLVSDGAHWEERGADRTGEVLAVRADPVSLVQELYETQKVRLHAVGVSEEETFWPWWRAQRGHEQPDVSIIPNHRLLRAMVTEGGGDASRTGGMEVLEEYFSALGAGVTRSVGRPRPGISPPAQAGISALFPEVRPVAVSAQATRIGEVAGQVQQLFSACVLASARRVGKPIYRASADPQALYTIGDPVTSRATFNAWVVRAYGIFHEKMDSRLRAAKPDKPYDIPEVRDIIWDGRLARLHVLRLDASHDEPGNGNKNGSEEHRLEVGKIFADITGVYHLMDDDADGWGKMQLALLIDLRGMFEDMEKVINRAPASAAEEELQIVWS